MNYPTKRTATYDIALYLYKAEQATMEDCQFDLKDYQPQTIKAAIARMKRENMLEVDDKLLSVKGYLRRWFDKQYKPALEIVQPRTSEWKPLDLSRLPSLEAKRADALPARKISFKSTNVAALPVWG
jgi:hypothetical protein